MATDLTQLKQSIDTLNTQLEGQISGAAPSIKGKTNGFKSSEFWVALGTAALPIVDSYFGTQLTETGGTAGLAYIVGRTFLKSVLVGAEAYQNKTAQP